MRRITVCRDCCCGSVRKVPGLDHDEQTRQLAEVAEIRVSACLDVCDQANVIVVQPTPEGRAAGGRPVWLA
ncbi:(2Fe-2S) ferredoxin domain-containing protein, partial [Nonomuraea longispora]